MSENSKDLKAESERVLDESARVQIAFIKTEIETALTLMKVARTEYVAQDVQAARRAEIKAQKALDEATKLVDEFELKGRSMHAVRELLTLAKTAFVELPGIRQSALHL